MHKNMSLAIGRADGLSSVGGVETINLPSQLVQAVGNEWQGCTALKGLYNNIRLVSALPCFQNQWESSNIKGRQRKRYTVSFREIQRWTYYHCR